MEAIRRAGLDVAFVEKEIQSQRIKDLFRQATTDAGDKGVDGVPTVIVSDRIYFGDDQLERAAKFSLQGSSTK